MIINTLNKNNESEEINMPTLSEAARNFIEAVMFEDCDNAPSTVDVSDADSVDVTNTISGVVDDQKDDDIISTRTIDPDFEGVATTTKIVTNEITGEKYLVSIHATKIPGTGISEAAIKKAISENCIILEGKQYNEADVKKALKKIEGMTDEEKKRKSALELATAISAFVASIASAVTIVAGFWPISIILSCATIIFSEISTSIDSTGEKKLIRIFNNIFNAKLKVDARLKKCRSVSQASYYAKRSDELTKAMKQLKNGIDKHCSDDTKKTINEMLKAHPEAFETPARS